jgi:hypothetical protein
LDEGHARYVRTHANLELRQRTHRADSAGARWLALMSGAPEDKYRWGGADPGEPGYGENQGWEYRGNL